MKSSQLVNLTSKDGLRGTIDMTTQSLNLGEGQVFIVHMENGQQLEVPADLLIRRTDGHYYLPVSLAEIEALRQNRSAEKIVLPVIEEEVNIQKRQAEVGRVRISKVVHEREQLVDEPGFVEEVDIERVTVNKLLDGPVSVRYEGDTMVVPLLEEVIVIKRNLMLREELRITKRRKEIRDPQQVVLRREDVVVERVDGRAQDEIPVTSAEH